MSRQGKQRTVSMMNELRARLGEERYRTLMLTITDNLEAYAIAQDAG